MNLVLLQVHGFLGDCGVFTSVATSYCQWIGLSAVIGFAFCTISCDKLSTLLLSSVGWDLHDAITKTNSQSRARR